jgi:phosphopantetheinyl transferase
VKRWLIVRDRYDLTYFTDDELATADTFRLQKRRDEWLLARFAAKKLALELGIASDPRACSVARPALLVDGEPSAWFVSISHSEPYAAAALDRAPVGIDIQVVRELPEQAAHLFLSDEETEVMQRCTIADRILHFWGAKEAAFKQRSGEFSTLRQLPLALREERANGLDFDLSTTRRLDDSILSLTPPTS